MIIELDLSYSELMLLINSMFITGFGMRENDDFFTLRKAVFNWHTCIGPGASTIVSLEKKLAEAAEKYMEHRPEKCNFF